MFFFVALEKACQVQLLADAASNGSGHPTIKVTPADAAATYRTNGTPQAGWFQGLTEFQLLEAKEGKTFSFGK